MLGSLVPTPPGQTWICKSVARKRPRAASRVAKPYTMSASWRSLKASRVLQAEKLEADTCTMSATKLITPLQGDDTLASLVRRP